MILINFESPDIEKCERLINAILTEFNHNSGIYSEDAIKRAERVLFLFKIEIEKKSRVNERVLRALHDLGMAAYKDFENSIVEVLIYKLLEIVGNNIPMYRKLEPLRGDFGKGDPI